MFSRRILQILGVVLIVVVAALVLSAISVAAQGGNWGGGGMIVSRFGDFFGVILRLFSLIFGF